MNRRGAASWPRTLGIAALGLVGGVLAGIILTDVVASIVVTGPGSAEADDATGETIPIVLLVVAPLAMPVCGSLGVVIAVLIDRAVTRRRMRRFGPTPRGREMGSADGSRG